MWESAYLYIEDGRHEGAEERREDVVDTPGAAEGPIARVDPGRLCGLVHKSFQAPALGVSDSVEALVSASPQDLWARPQVVSRRQC